MEQPCRVLSSNRLQLRSDLSLHHAIVVENKRGKPVVCQVYPRRIEGATDLAIQAAARLLEENGRGIVLRRCKRKVSLSRDRFQLLPCINMEADEFLGCFNDLTVRNTCHGVIRERDGRNVSS